MSEKSFWDFFIPQAQSAVEGAKTAADEGNEDWAHKLLDSASDQLKSAKSQTENQIADRNAGTYDPDKYHENSEERSVHHPKHKDYEPDDMTPAQRRAAHREGLKNL